MKKTWPLLLALFIFSSLAASADPSYTQLNNYDFFLENADEIFIVYAYSDWEGYSYSYPWERPTPYFEKVVEMLPDVNFVTLDQEESPGIVDNINLKITESDQIFAVKNGKQIGVYTYDSQPSESGLYAWIVETLEGDGQSGHEDFKTALRRTYGAPFTPLEYPNKFSEKLNDDNFSSRTEDKLYIVDWFAAWCGPCQAFAPMFEKISKMLPDVNFGIVDVEESPGISEKIPHYPYLTMVKNGKIEKVYYGDRNEVDICSWITDIMIKNGYKAPKIPRSETALAAFDSTAAYNFAGLHPFKYYTEINNVVYGKEGVEITEYFFDHEFNLSLHDDFDYKNFSLSMKFMRYNQVDYNYQNLFTMGMYSRWLGLTFDDDDNLVLELNNGEIEHTIDYAELNYGTWNTVTISVDMTKNQIILCINGKVLPPILPGDNFSFFYNDDYCASDNIFTTKNLGSANSFYGIIQDVLVFDKVLSVSELQALSER